MSSTRIANSSPIGGRTRSSDCSRHQGGLRFWPHQHPPWTPDLWAGTEMRWPCGPKRRQTSRRSPWRARLCAGMPACHHTRSAPERSRTVHRHFDERSKSRSPRATCSFDRFPVPSRAPRPTQAAARRRLLESLAAVWQELEGADRALMARLECAFLHALRCATLVEARSCVRNFARPLLTEENLCHGYESFLSSVADDTIADHECWLESVVENGLGISTPLKSWSDDHASQAEFLLRRNLLALRQARDLLTDCKVHGDAAPFLVFWPNPSISLGTTAQNAMHKVSSLVEAIRPSERTAVIVELARMDLSSK